MTDLCQECYESERHTAHCPLCRARAEIQQWQALAHDAEAIFAGLLGETWQEVDEWRQMYRMYCDDGSRASAVDVDRDWETFLA